MSLKKIVLSALIGLLGSFSAATMSIADVTSPAIEDEGDFIHGFYYTIQEGDTLWDLSRKFYDSEWTWPALWGQNKDIPNPHWIYPGNRIRLHQKADTLTHSDKAKPLPEREPEVIVVPEIVVTKEKPQAQSASMPPSPPKEPELYFHFPQISLIGFVKDLPGGLLGKPEDPLAIGHIFRSLDKDIEMIGERDIVYIKPDRNDVDLFIVGNQYLIYKPLIRVKDQHSGGYAGYQYKIAGVIEVNDTTPAYIVAQVVKIIRLIQAGDMIMPFPNRPEKIALKPSPKGLTGHVLVTEEHSRMSADYDTIFLDKGRQDGVKAGQRYDIFYQDEHKVNGESMLLPPVTYGKVLVLLAEETTATATITNATRSIGPGDRFKSP